MALAILSCTSPTFTIPHAMSFTPLVHLMGGGNNHLGTSYFHSISIPFVAAIGVVHHRFRKFSLISSATSLVPSIRSYWALSVVINVCQISLIDSAGGRLCAENTLVHLVVHIHHIVMGASNVQRSPSFWFYAQVVGTLLSVISHTMPFSPLYLASHVPSYFATSSSRQIQQACRRIQKLWVCHQNNLEEPMVRQGIQGWQCACICVYRMYHHGKWKDIDDHKHAMNVSPWMGHDEDF